MQTPDASQTPLLAAMQRYLAERAQPFHTPGHKGGRGAPECLLRHLGPSTLELDLAVVPGLGDLFDRQGPIRESQKLAAALYGADSSYFLVNGTTGGVYAMVLATVGPGEKIIVPRNIHRSVMGALILSGAVPVFVRPELDPEFQIAMNVPAESVAAAIQDHPDAKAVLMVNPTYYGVTADLKAVVELSHSRGMAVLVDEAHGPHFRFSSHLPPDGISAGADVVVQSTHKILASLSQSSLLHCQGDRIPVPRLESMLQLTQSSSPNYILLASLETAVAQMRESGSALVDRSVALARQARSVIDTIPGLRCLGPERAGSPGVNGVDPTKIVVGVGGLGLRGNEAENWLRRNGGVQPELSDANNVLFLITLADDVPSVRRLTDALTALAHAHSGGVSRQTLPQLVFPDEPAPLLLSPREAVFGRRERIAFGASSGRICAETITSYPPGIPILCPGEQITPAAVDYCRALQRQGFTILGPEDPGLNTVEVVA